MLVPPNAVSLSRRRFVGATAAFGMLSVGQASRAATVGQPPLTIWFTVEGAKAMRRIAERFTADTGVEVIVETPDPMEGPTKFQQASSAGKGPDMYIYAHDRIGEWVSAGLVRAVNPSRRILQDVDPIAWKGFRYGGRIWGYPYAVEAVTLIYNKALVSTPPASFDDVFALDAALSKQVRHAIIWDYTNTYFTWPLLAANGGYAFRERTDGSYDARDTGVTSTGALVGARLLERMIREGLMPAGSEYPDMEAAVAQGRAAMMINGPWAWLNLQRVGIDFGIANIPTVAGKVARPYVGIKGIMINRASQHAELATEFIENYVLSLPGLRALNQAEPIGAPASRAYLAELSADPRIAGIMRSARDGVPTPSIPEMGRFWSSMKTSLKNLTEGRQTPEQAMAAAARRIVQD